MNTLPNIVNSRILYDSTEKAVIQLVGYYTAACTAANLKVVTANALYFGNTSQTCLVAVEKIQYEGSLNGFVSLDWIGAANTSFFVMKNGAGMMEGAMFNDATTPTGDINARTYNVNANDAFTITLSLRKIQGYSNGTVWFDQ